MKCSNCWSRRIDVAETNLLHKILAACLMVKPVKCRHCFNSFHVPLWVGYESEQDTSTAESADEHGEEMIVPFPEIEHGVQSRSDAEIFRKAA